MRRQALWTRAMRHPAVWTAALAVISCVPMSGQAGTHPPELSVAGSSIRLLGQATRVHLAGVEDLYTIGLYAAGPFDRAKLVSEEAVKALRIAVTYEHDWRRPMIVDWPRELVPRTEPGAVAHLRGVFAPLRRGDVVLIEYTPRRGTTVRVNTSIAVFAAKHDLMLAFLDHWLGQRPVSEEVKQALLAGPPA
jgi:hypothetical protein